MSQVFKGTPSNFIPQLRCHFLLPCFRILVDSSISPEAEVPVLPGTFSVGMSHHQDPIVYLCVYHPHPSPIKSVDTFQLTNMEVENHPFVDESSVPMDCFPVPC